MKDGRRMQCLPLHFVKIIFHIGQIFKPQRFGNFKRRPGCHLLIISVIIKLTGPPDVIFTFSSVYTGAVLQRFHI